MSSVAFGGSREIVAQAIMDDDTKKVAEFIEAGCDFSSLYLNDPKYIDGKDYSFYCSESTYVLQLASRYGRFAVVKQLVGTGLDPNVFDQDGDTPLCSAAREDHLDVVRFLIDAGAQVNANCSECKKTALQEALCNGNLTTIKMLVKAGAEVDNMSKVLIKYVEDGYSAEVACVINSIAYKDDYLSVEKKALIEKGLIGLVRLLVDSGCDVNIDDENSKTYLMIAVEEGYLNIVRLLVDNDANITAQDREGKTALIFAQENGHAVVVEYLSSL